MTKPLKKRKGQHRDLAKELRESKRVPNTSVAVLQETPPPGSVRTIKKWGQELQPSEAAFVMAYLADPRTGPAYLAAGYKAKNAQVANAYGWMLMKRPRVQAALSAALIERLKPLEVSAEKTLAEVVRIAFSDLTSMFNDDRGHMVLKPLSEWPRDVRSAVQAIDLSGDGPKVRMWDKLGALRILCDYFQLIEVQTQRHIHEVHITEASVMRLSEGELVEVAGKLAREAAQIAAEMAQAREQKAKAK